MLESRFLSKTVADDLALGLLQFELKSRQFVATQKRVRDVVLKTRVAAFGGLFLCCHIDVTFVFVQLTKLLGPPFFGEVAIGQ